MLNYQPYNDYSGQGSSPEDMRRMFMRPRPPLSMQSPQLAWDGFPDPQQQNQQPTTKNAHDDGNWLNYDAIKKKLGMGGADPTTPSDQTPGINPNGGGGAGSVGQMAQDGGTSILSNTGQDVMAGMGKIFS